MASRIATTALLLTAFLSAPLAANAQTEKCEGKRHGAIGKYELCIHKARAKALASGALVDTSACEDKLATTWAKLALSSLESCPDGDLAGIQDVADAANEIVTGAIQGVPAPHCGDSDVNVAGEQCDGTDLDGESCATLGYDKAPGALACDTSCRFDLAGCMGTCGDNQVNAPGEACDGTDLNGIDCSDFGLGGNVTCLPNCQVSTSQCLSCGDGVPSESHCYYLGGFNSTCADVCAVRGMAYDAAGTVRIGSGGAAQGCFDVLEALEVPPSQYNESLNCGASMYGFGCTLHPSGWWWHCNAPATTQTAGGDFFRRVCACTPL